MKLLNRLLFLAITVIMLAGCTRIENDLTNILLNIQRNLQPIWTFLITLSYVLGIWFMGLAIFKLKQYGQMTVMMSTHASLGPSVAFLMVGAGLLYLPTLLDVLMVSFWQYGTENILGGYAIGGRGFEDIIVPLVQLVQVIGLIAFIRGWIMLAKLGSQGAPPGTLNKGLLHMLGGILAINIVGTIHMLQASLGLV